MRAMERRGDEKSRRGEERAADHISPFPLPSSVLRIEEAFKHKNRSGREPFNVREQEFGENPDPIKPANLRILSREFSKREFGSNQIGYSNA